MMSHIKDQLLLKSELSVWIFLLLIHCSEGQHQLTGPTQPIVAMFGDDIVLPCRLEPAVDAAARTVEWSRPDLKQRIIHFRRDSVDLLTEQNPSYTRRTSLSISKLKSGDVSLKLSKVKLSDAGTYKCIVSKYGTESAVELVVGSVSSPEIEVSKDSSSLVLQCESAGWYPEPEVLWLDAEGNLLSAGPTETVRGPDDLYSVSSRVTVEKKHGNKFTCRVQQNNINQTRDTWIHVPHDFFVVQSCSTSTTVSLAVCMVVSIILFILAVVVFIHMRRQNRTKRREDVQVKCEEEALMLMKTLEKEKQPESKRVNKEAEVSLLVDEERHQDQLKEEELKQKEEQRKKEAENMIQRLQEKLDMKKTEVENKQSELQRFQEEKKKIQEDLQNLIKDLDTKITKLKTIREELTKSSWISYYAWLQNEKKLTETEGKLKIEILNMIQELEEMMRLMTGPIAVVEVHEQDCYICLKNISSEEINLEGWELELQINDRETAMCTFYESLKLQAGKSLTICRPGFYMTHPDDVNVEWSGLNKWRPEDKLQINIISKDGEIFRLL